METIDDNLPCTSLGLVSGFHFATAGMLGGWCIGSYDAVKLGLIGSTGLPHLVRSMGVYGFMGGLYGAVFTSTHCGMQHYRWKDDWVNAFTGATAAALTIDAGERYLKYAVGGAINTGKRSWKLSEELSNKKGIKMVKGTLSEEIHMMAAASEVWKVCGTLELKRVVEEQLHGYVEKVDVVEGDGGVGTILNVVFTLGATRLQSYKEKYTVVDDEKRVKEVEIVEGGYLDLGFTLYKTRIEVIEDGENKCITRTTIEYEAKGEAANAAPSIVTIQPLVAIMKGVADASNA